MTIAELDTQIKGIISVHKVYGAECVINALMRLVHQSFEHEKMWEE